MSRRPTPFAAIGALAALAVIGTALAAGVGTPTTNAGQGVGDVAGYTTTEFQWDLRAAEQGEPAGDYLTAVRFIIRTEQDGTGPSTVTGANTTVYLRLDTASGSTWVPCTVAATPDPGSVTCSIDPGDQPLDSDVTGLDVLAYAGGS